MSDYIGEASVKITGDIKPLQEAVKKVEQVVAPLKNKQLEGFKINYDGKQFESFQAYTEEINKQQQEFENYLKTEEQAVKVEKDLSSAFKETSSSVEVYNGALETTTETVSEASDSMKSKFSIFFENFRDNLQQASDYAEGFALRLKHAFERKISTDRGILAFTLSLVALFKKCMDSAREADASMGKNMESIDESFSKVGASIGRLAEPIVSVLEPALKLLGEALNFVTTPLRWLAEGIDNVKGFFGGLFDSITGTVRVTKEETEALNRVIKNVQLIESNIKKLDEAYKNMSESVAEVNKEMEESLDSYQQSLKQILVTHEGTVGKLTDQILEANKDYERAIEERNASFIKSQAKEEKAHQEKVEELQTQLNFLQRYNNAYNKEKLEAVKFALAREEALYKKQTEAQKEELDKQNEYDKKKRDEKLALYERELQDERDFLNKHAEVFNEVRNTMLRDEVENLQKSYNAQVENATKTKDAIISEYNNLAREIQQNNRVLDIANQIYSRWSAIKDVIKTLVANYRDFVYYNEQIIRSLPDDDKLKKVASVSQSIFTTTQRLLNGYADGGYTGKGGKNEVAGIVHKGEYVLPQEMVDQKTGTPKVSGGNITINLSGVFATSEAEQRKVAQQIVNAINQTNYARLGA